MKKITLLLILLTVSFGYSQSLPIDFDDPLDANFVGSGGSSFSIVMDGTDNVGQTIGGTDQYNSRVDLALDTWIDMTTANKTFTFDFYTSEAVVMTGLFQIGNKQAGGTDVFPIEMQFTTDGSIGWQTITLDFNGATNGYPNAADPVEYGQYAQVSIFTNFGDTGTSTYWFDDIAGAANGGAVETCSDGVQNQDETGIDCGGVCAPCVTPPTIAAPTPPARPATDVVSVYSDAYTTTMAFDNFDAGWCGGAHATEVMIDGNNTLQKNTGIVCQGIDFQNDRQDLSAFTHIHFDFYITDTDLTGDVFNVKLVDFAGGGGEASALEININGGTNPALVANTWVSVDVDITAIGGVVAGSLTRSDIAQIGITTAMVDNVWYDNIYLHKDTVLSTNEFDLADFSVYPNPSNNFWNVKTNSQVIETIQVFDILGKQVLSLNPNSNEAQIDSSTLNTGLYFAKINTEAGTSSVKLIKN